MGTARANVNKWVVGEDGKNEEEEEKEGKIRGGEGVFKYSLLPIDLDTKTVAEEKDIPTAKLCFSIT